MPASSSRPPGRSRFASSRIRTKISAGSTITRAICSALKSRCGVTSTSIRRQQSEVASAATTLQIGSSGDLVAAMQRTLNARMKPSPGIGSDGDFGPETEGAVKRFQTQEKLKPTGIVDDKTWKALGPLIMEDEPAPEPAVVNAEQSKKSPAGIARRPAIRLVQGVGDSRWQVRQVPGRRPSGRKARPGQHDQDDDGLPRGTAGREGSEGAR